MARSGIEQGSAPIASAIGILGGTFDPVHLGHVEGAIRAKEALDLDGVLIIPASKPSFKRDRDIAPFEDRLEMCRLATKDIPFIEISDIEGKRDGISYTIDTLLALKESLSEGSRLHFIIGSDAFADLGKWRRSSDIVNLADFAVMMRSEDEEQRILGIADDLGASVNILEGTRLNISSTDIRGRIQEGENMDGYLARDVYEYIMDRGLYRA